MHSLSLISQHIPVYNLRQDPVADFVLFNKNRAWNLHLRRQTYEWEYVQVSGSLAFLEAAELDNSTSDSILWSNDSSECFSIKDFRHIIVSNRISTIGSDRDIYNLVWWAEIPAWVFFNVGIGEEDNHYQG